MTVSIDRYASQTSSNDFATRLEQVLQDIVNNIAIQSDFSIVHPEYGSIELAKQLQARFGQMPDHVQNSYLQVKLQQFLYDNYYSYSLPRLTEEGENNEKIENQAIKWSKSEFLEQLRQNNHSQNHFESGWLIVGQTDEGLLQVKKDDLTLHIGSRHLQDVDQSAQVGDIVAVKMPPQLVERGFYIAVGTAGSINHLAQESDTQIVDIYLNLSSDGAVALMDSLTIELNVIEIPFHFKVLYRPEDYIVCNTAVLSFERRNYNRVKVIIETVYQKNKSYFKPEIPLFTKYLAPGLSIAERPNSDSLQLDFAPNRCQIIAQALILAWQERQESPEVKLKYICDRFSEAGIDLKRPYLNPNSEDIY